jgi:hypothetical protein
VHSLPHSAVDIVLFFVVELPSLLAFAIIERIHVTLVITGFTSLDNSAPQLYLIATAYPMGNISRLAHRIVPSPCIGAA